MTNTERLDWPAPDYWCTICDQGAEGCNHVPADAGSWRVRAVRQRAFIATGSAWAAVAPGCPAGPHPHRDCECQIFTIVADVLAYKAAKENAPAAGGHQREGEDQNPTRGTRSVTNHTPELAAAAEILSLPIASVLPDAWATETEIADADSDPMITHTREEVAGDFRIVLSHNISNIDLGTDVLVKWDELGAEGGVTPEEFVISVSSIPGLIAALQRAQAVIAP